MTTTLAALQAGSSSIGWIALLEGCKYVLSDKPQAAVRAALAGTDWESAEVINGLFVSLMNQQSIDPDSAFSGSGRCTLRVVDTDGLDTFGTFINKRLSGAESEVTATVDRDDTTISVKSTTGFPSSGEAYIGVECFAYSGVTSTSFTGVTRGKYSPQSCDSSGSGTRFAGHHRYGVDARYIQRQPLVTQLPRVWIGKRASLYLHTWDASSGTLNTKNDAQLVFAGRIVGIEDDPDTFHTVIELEHYSEEWKNGVIGQDMWQAEISAGIWIAAGRKFQFLDAKDGVHAQAADLDVVSSGASGNYEMDEGFYSLGEICERVNAWLAQAKADGDIYGTYSWASPVSYRGDGLRTVCQWRIEDAGTKKAGWVFYAPMEVMGFLGLRDVEPSPSHGQMAGITAGSDKYTNRNYQLAGVAVPYTLVVFSPTGPARTGADISESVNYDVANERGSFIDQRALMPAALKSLCPPGEAYGVFLLDDRALMVGSYSSGRLKHCFVAPYQMTADNNEEALSYIGRRADEPQAPVTVRQCFILEGSFSTILKTLAYSTGVSGWNHGTYDTLGSGLGLGLPGSLLGGDFERSIDNLPCADSPIAIVLDEPTRFSELMSADLQIRRSFVRWREQGFELCQWKTPVSGNAVAALEEANKAAPAGAQENHRTALKETDEHQKTTVKIDYCRDFAVGRDGKYLKSISIEDQAATDSSGNGGTGGRSQTLKMRNTFAQFANTGTSVEALIPGFMATMPLFSQAARRFVRTIDLRYFEGLSVGDVVTIDDEFARDPLTGRRGIAGRAAAIVRHSCDYGGPSADGTTRQMNAEIEALFIDVHRGSAYSPSADVDETYSSGGYTAGYLSAGPTLRCKAHSYSHTVSFTTKNGTPVNIAEADDASHFEQGDAIVIIERDPANPSSPDMWSRTVVSVSGDDITLDTALSAPAFDSSKRYRIISAAYTTAQASQQDDCYQADDNDYMIQDADPPFHFVVGGEQVYNTNSGVGTGELIPTVSHGDGKPWDVSTDKAIAQTLNAYSDGKALHQMPLLMAGTDSAVAGLSGIANDTWATLYIYPIFCGTEHLSTAVSRVLTVAPWFRSADGTNAYVRVTLTDQIPTMFPAVEEGAPTAGAYGDAMLPGRFSRSTEWSTTSTTWQTGADYDLGLGVKDIFFGIAYVIVEGAGAAQCRGLAKCIEGPRVVT